MLSVFYLVFSFLDLFLLAMGDFFASPRDYWFLCIDQWYLLPRDDGGSIFLLFDGLILYLFTLMISHIFYKIPDNHGLLVNVIRPRGSEDMLIVKNTFVHKDGRSETMEEGSSLRSGIDDEHRYKKNDTQVFVE